MSSCTHSSFFLVLLFLILLQIPSSLANLYDDCSSKQFKCGQISAGFPFWGQGRPRGCGIPELELRCEGNGVVKTVLNRVEYIVLDINPSDELVTIARKDILEQGIPCPPQPFNSTFDPNIFEYAPGYTNITFIYGCVASSEAGGGGVPVAGLPFTCQINGAVSPTGYVELGDVGPGTCYRSIFLPVSETGLGSLIVNLDAFESTLKRGFEMKWKVDSGACGMCTESKGACGYDLIYNQTTCYCPNQSGGGSNSNTCSSSSSPSQTPTSIPASVSAADDERYLNCSAPFRCGDRQDIGYPFWGLGRAAYCGHPGFELTNCSTPNPAEIKIKDLRYQVLGMNKTPRTITVLRTDYSQNVCPDLLHNTSLDANFTYTPDTQNITLHYDCPSATTAPPALSGFQFTCNFNGSTTPILNYFTTPAMTALVNSLGSCKNKVDVSANESEIQTLAQNPSRENLLTALRKGFGLQWDANMGLCSGCESSGGECGYDGTTSEFSCFCKDEAYTLACGRNAASPTPESTPSSKSKSKTPLGIGLGIAGLAVIGGLVGGCFVIIKRKRKSLQAQSKGFQAPPSSKGLLTASTGFSSATPSYPSSRTTDLEKGSAYFGVTMFTYIELEEATNNFDSANQLGDGGFGIVYYGLLKDGRNVAVKRLYENNVKRAEQFMNEIEILTRLRHKNLVTLYGCTSRRSQELLLVYEYIANGTVADHVHGKHSNSGLLTWPVRLSIAIETADALTFLHASDVIHRDVKTNNILLGTNFQVKVADFGLSRLFPNDVTHVSTAPQGTPGYVDPEYYQCYQLTDKSDVYSFGVVLVELISSLQAVDTNRHRHDINLSNMAVNKIQNHELQELVDPSLGFDSDYAVKTMVTSVAGVAFRCLQQEREMRPKMEEVLKDLRRIESEYYGAGKAEVVDIREEAGLLKNVPPPLSFSPDSITDKWATGSPKTTPSSF